MHNKHTVVTDYRIKLTLPQKVVQKLTDEDLFEICMANKKLPIERNADGSLVVMEPTGSYGSNLNFTLAGLLFIWNRKHKLGKCFDSNGGFCLPNGAMRSPDVSWIPLPKWEALSGKEKSEFAAICPDFVVELRSKTDRLVDLQHKMEEYLANGTQLGWLIDPYEKRTYIYRPNQKMEIHSDWQKPLSGEAILPGFDLTLTELDE